MVSESVKFKAAETSIYYIKSNQKYLPKLTLNKSFVEEKAYFKMFFKSKN